MADRANQALKSDYEKEIHRLMKEKADLSYQLEISRRETEIESLQCRLVEMKSQEDITKAWDQEKAARDWEEASRTREEASRAREDATTVTLDFIRDKMHRMNEELEESSPDMDFLTEQLESMCSTSS